jgi:putative transposase
MVAGFSLAFESPSSLSVGLCLTHAILPKDVWLSKHGIATPWPLHGLMDSVHCDNGREFRGNMLRKACEQYAIELTFRPVKRPWYGGHIERLLGTFVKEIHALAGTTFSNPAQRGTYDSEGRAIFTLSEFEAWLTRFIVEVYHQRVHTALGMPPLRRYEQAVAGVAPRCPDAYRLKLDFLPYEERSVQRYGLALDGVHYYSDVLRRWIDSREPEDAKRKKAFIVRRDPRDVSVVYFFDPELNCYFEIPYRDTSRPAMTLWELREARTKLREQGVAKMDEDLIFQAYRKLRTLEEEAGKATRKARREPVVNAGTAKPEPVSGAAVDSSEDIRPFEEIEPWP